MRLRYHVALLAPLVLAAGLAACDTTASLVQLRHAAPPEDRYSELLADAYRRYAEGELADYDWWSSQHFADKGLKLARTGEAEPERPEAWKDIASADREALAQARASLLERLTPQVKAERPEMAASAMLHFDCWVEHADEGWDSASIARCRDGFRAALAQLTPPAPVATAPRAPVKPVRAAPSHHARLTTHHSPAPRALPEVSQSMVLYFPLDGAQLHGEALAQVQAMIASLRQRPQARIIINGHADRAGEDQYNLRLSARRAQYIRQMLIENGVPAARVEYFAFGESDPAVPTPDDTTRLENRRVELFLE